MGRKEGREESRDREGRRGGRKKEENAYEHTSTKHISMTCRERRGTK